GGVAHYALDDDASCIAKIRDLVERLPDGSPTSSPDQAAPKKSRSKSAARTSAKSSPKRDAGAERLYDLLPADHRMSYDMHPVLAAILDDGKLDEFQGGLAKEMICGDGAVDGITVGVIANQRGLIKAPLGEKPRFGGIIYTE